MVGNGYVQMLLKSMAYFFVIFLLLTQFFHMLIYAQKQKLALIANMKYDHGSHVNELTTPFFLLQDRQVE